jgi:hypothetical protein
VEENYPYVSFRVFREDGVKPGKGVKTTAQSSSDGIRDLYDVFTGAIASLTYGYQSGTSHRHETINDVAQRALHRTLSYQASTMPCD